MGKLPLKRLSYEDLRSIADDCLERFHPDLAIPIPIEEIIDLKLKIDIVPVSRLEWDDDTAAYITADLNGRLMLLQV